jgi:hypothetical protein
MIYFDFLGFRMALSVSGSLMGMTWSGPMPGTVYRVHPVNWGWEMRVPLGAVNQRSNQLFWVQMDPRLI